MHFVRIGKLTTEDKLATPIFDKKGGCVFESGTKLTQSIIVAIRNMGICGAFVLEPAEPVKPLPKEDMDYYSFLSAKSYELSEELKEVVVTHRLHRLEYIADEIIDAYCPMRKRLCILNDVRGINDFAFRHSVNTAILASLIVGRLGYSIREKRSCISACLVHDMGKTIVPDFLIDEEDLDEMVSIFDNSQDTGFELIELLFAENPEVVKICGQAFDTLTNFRFERKASAERLLNPSMVLLVAETFEVMTSMSIAGTQNRKSAIYTIRYLYSHPEIFNKKMVDALVDSLKILEAGTSVVLSNKKKALVISENSKDVLFPVVLEFGTNKMIDLSNREACGNIEIVDVVDSLDNRYSMK